MTDSVYVTQVIALYWVVSISMVYLNKILLSNEEASIPAPLFVTWYQVSLLSRLLVMTSSSPPLSCLASAL
jgi:solute carrier family 35 (GDP-fucose transporter), member C1